MLISARNSEVASDSISPSDEQAALLRMEEQLPPLLSVIAGMVDLTGFFMLGNIFTAHVTPATSWSRARLWCVEAR